MFPRNITLFRFGPTPCENVAAALDQHRGREPGPLEMSARGFVSPYAMGDQRLTIEHEGCTAFVFELRTRLLPASIINEALTKKVQAVAEEEGRKVGGRERKRLKEDVVTELMKHAPVKPSRTLGWIDTKNGWLVLDTSSRRAAEDVLTGLREAFGSFPAVPLAPEEGPRVLLTDWLANSTLPEKLALGDQCELRDPSTATGALVRCRRQDLDADEVREHLRNGKQVFQMGLVFDGRLYLVLGEDLVLKGVSPLDVILDAYSDCESKDMQREQDFALAVLEVRRLLEFIEQTFRLPRPVLEA